MYTDWNQIFIKKIQQELKEYFSNRISQPVTFSAGLLYLDLCKDKLTDASDLIGRVDKLLYAAKNSGKNKIVTNECELQFDKS